MMKKGIHDGHRQRVREEFLRNGIDEKTPPHKVIEFLLFYCVPRVDTNDLAHELINRYKTVSGVLDAPFEELIKFPGITENGATLLKMFIPIARIYEVEKNDKAPGFNSIDEVGDYIVKRYYSLTVERFGIIYINGIGKNLGFEFLFEGDIGSVGISERDVVSHVLKKEATCVVIAHNHPNGVALPSQGDIEVTKLLVEALKHIGVRLIDHLIICRGEYVSMAQSREYAHIFPN